MFENCIYSTHRKLKVPDKANSQREAISIICRVSVKYFALQLEHYSSHPRMQ